MSDGVTIEIAQQIARALAKMSDDHLVEDSERRLAGIGLALVSVVEQRDALRAAAADHQSGWATVYKQGRHDAGAIQNTALEVERGITDALRAEVERLTAALAVQTELLADANAQLNAMRIDRGRYKAWCDKVMAQEPVAVCTVKDGDLMMMIVRPQPLEKV